eukprot:751820-Hanusia_phi.AAC.2
MGGPMLNTCSRNIRPSFCCCCCCCCSSSSSSSSLPPPPPPPPPSHPPLLQLIPLFTLTPSVEPLSFPAPVLRSPPRPHVNLLVARDGEGVERKLVEGSAKIVVGLLVPLQQDSEVEEREESGEGEEEEDRGGRSCGN